MSSIYRSCSPRRVAAPALVARSLTARVVYLHLLVGELAGQVPGIVRAGADALAEDVGLEVADVRAALTELEQYGLAEVDLGARLIRLPGVVTDCAGAASVPLAGWAEALRLLPDSPLKDRHAAEIRAAFPGIDSPGFVYFIQAGTAGGPIKIGYSYAPETRLAQLQTSMPDTLRLLAAMPGSVTDERALHSKLRLHRLRGEWFLPHADVLAEVAAARSSNV